MKTFTNPFIWADVPDPDIIRVGDVYYMTSTTMYFTPGCPVMRSTNLVQWEIIGYVYDKLSDNDHMNLCNGKNDYGKGSWASSLRYNNGIFYCAFVAYNTNKTYIFQTDDIEKGNWQKYVIDGIYHDMSLLFDDDGKVYMVYGVFEIKIIELTADATAIKQNGLNTTIIKNADISGGNDLAEGAHIYKLNGKYYIFVICWPQTGKKRRIQVCYRADSITGNYEGKIILDDDLDFFNAGVAQGGIVDTPTGEWYALLFQDHGAVGRIPVLVPVSWIDEWPILGENGKVPITMPYPAPPVINTKISTPLVIPDNFDTPTLAYEWQWNHNPDKNYWSLLARTGWLRLITGCVVDGLLNAINTLTQRTFGPTCSGSVMLDVTHMKDGDYAGLAALQELFGFVGVSQRAGKKYIVMETHDTKHTNVAPILLEQSLIYLKIDFMFTTATSIIDEAYFYYSYDGDNWEKIGAKLKMEYKLSHFTGYRFALFNYATKTTGGYVDFDWFNVSTSLN